MAAIFGGRSAGRDWVVVDVSPSVWAGNEQHWERITAVPSSDSALEKAWRAGRAFRLRGWAHEVHHRHHLRGAGDVAARHVRLQAGGGPGGDGGQRRGQRHGQQPRQCVPRHRTVRLVAKN